MDIFADVVRELQRLSEAECRRVAEGSGVPLGTLIKIKYGQTPNPRIRTVLKLHEHLVRSKAMKEAA